MTNRWNTGLRRRARGPTDATEPRPGSAEATDGGEPRPEPAEAADGAEPRPGSAETTDGVEPRPESAQPRPQVPRMLQQAAAWSWRLLLVGALIYITFRLAAALRLVVLPVIAAMLLTALLQPLKARLRRSGMSHLLATWLTFLVAVAVIAGLAWLTVNRVSAEYPTFVREVTATAHSVQRQLAGPPFHINSAKLSKWAADVEHYVSAHRAVIAGTVLTGGRIAIEILTGAVLTLFVTFFLVKDGERIWKWLIKGLRPQAQDRAHRAGTAAWQTLVNYMRGSTLIAAIHAVVIGLTLWLLGVPLLVPLVILIFLAAFVPLIGILVVGGLAILITLGTRGWVAAVILLAVLLVEDQLEGHLLQPMVTGRLVRLHPLAVILVLAVGGIIAGIAGAIVAVPLTAVITYAWPHLRGPGPDQTPVSTE